MTSRLYIGVDGGASNTRARIRDGDGRCLGEGTSGPGNVWLDLDGATANIIAACRTAAAAAGLTEAALSGAHAGLGLAGAVTEGARRATLAQPFPFATVTVDNDAYAACLGAHGGKDGAILILGTGSCGLAVVRGVRTNVGGWGQVISDHASGGRIGREALRRALWACEGVVPMTELAHALLAPFDEDPGRTAEWAKTATPAQFAALVPAILEHAARRDPLAVETIAEAGAEAGRMVERLLACGAPTVCLVGGLAGPLAPWLAPPLRARLAEPAGDAMDGAILMARQTHTTDARR
jgi:glucosamine kinase